MRCRIFQFCVGVLKGGGSTFFWSGPEQELSPSTGPWCHLKELHFYSQLPFDVEGVDIFGVGTGKRVGWDCLDTCWRTCVSTTIGGVGLFASIEASVCVLGLGAVFLVCEVS